VENNSLPDNFGTSINWSIVKAVAAPMFTAGIEPDTLGIGPNDSFFSDGLFMCFRVRVCVLM
jgi:hypothetical protein